MNKLRLFWKWLMRYLLEVWIEIRPNKGRVAWPTFDSVKISTKVVIISALAVGLFIGVLDYFFSELLRQVVGWGSV